MYNVFRAMLSFFEFWRSKWSKFAIGTILPIFSRGEAARVVAPRSGATMGKVYDIEKGIMEERSLGGERRAPKARA